MQVVLNKIEQLSDGSAHIVFVTEFDSVYFSFIVPKAYATTACNFIINSTFTHKTLLFVDTIAYERTGKESLLFTSYSALDGEVTEFQITQYKITSDYKPFWKIIQ